MSRLFDIFGLGTGRRFYMRDFKNAYKFRPDVNPVRQKFQGYVNFIFNRESPLFRELYADPSDGSKEFRTTISSLVRTADLPGVNFQTEIKNSYNRKKIVNLGVEYTPVNMSLYDTVGNEWLTVLMRYFSYHYMGPRNKGGDGRDITGAQSRIGGSEQSTGFMQSGWDSNRAGYNTNLSANFFERIDYVLYHGNKGVQYSIINPVLTSFKPGPIDYSDSSFREFEVTFDYESFTTHNVINFELSEEDIDRFEDVREVTGPAFTASDEPLSLTEREYNMLGKTSSNSNDNSRSRQPLPTDLPNTEPPPVDEDGNPVTPTPLGTPPATYGGAFQGGTSGPGEDDNVFGGLLGGVVDAALTAAIQGGDIKDAAVGAAVGGVLSIIEDSVDEGNGNG